MPAAKPTIPADRLARYDALIDRHPEIERKGAAMPYTSYNGNMFSFLSPEGVMGLRLPEPARSAFLVKYRTSLCEAHGRVLVEYVQVPDALLAKPAELERHLAASLAYVKALAPKPTTRPKRAAAKAKKTSAKASARGKRR